MPPEKFIITFPTGKETSNPRPLVVFDTTDALSGLSHYKIQIGDNKTQVASSDLVSKNPYQLALQKPGVHTILVQAFDQAGNYSTATEEFKIVELQAPKLIKYPSELSSGDILTIKGATIYPQSQVTVWLQPDGGEALSQAVAADEQGNFTFVYKEKLPENTYQAWATVQNEQGALSGPSEKITLAVKLPPVLKFGKIALDYLTLMTTFVLLLIGIIVTVVYSWHWVSYGRKKMAKISKVTRETEKDMRQTFTKLRDQVEE